MSDKSTAYLRLNKQEARSLLGWFMFQEHANTAPYEGSEASTITTEEIALLNKIRSCVRKMNEEPEKYQAMRLAPHYCRVVYNWYSNLPECLVDDEDADIHASLGMFLDEQQDEPEKGI
jgi:hypothetical protein